MLADVTAVGQLVRLMVKRVAEACVPAAPKELAATVPRLTVCVAELVLTVQAVSRILPVKFIVPSAANTAGHMPAAASTAISVVFFIIIPRLKITECCRANPVNLKKKQRNKLK
jgi:hypothetical protein